MDPGGQLGQHDGSVFRVAQNPSVLMTGAFNRRAAVKRHNEWRPGLCLNGGGDGISPLHDRRQVTDADRGIGAALSGMRCWDGQIQFIRR